MNAHWKLRLGVVCLLSTVSTPARSNLSPDGSALRQLARETVATAELKPGAKTTNGINTTGRVLHLPGGSDSYPAFWVRDAAMMLGGGLIAAEEIEGWIKVIAAVQPGAEGIRLQHGLSVPGYSIPDHINVNGKAVWFPGTYADGDEQGTGQYGFLPPADDAFYFIQMVREYADLTGSTDFLNRRLPTGWGEQSLIVICDRAFESVAADPATGLVICEEAEGRTRVDWGFCDSVRKTGLALFPSVLRYRAARDLAFLHVRLGAQSAAHAYRQIAVQLRESVAKTFLRKVGEGEALLLSATGLGGKYDVWGSSFAVAEGILPADAEAAVCRGLHAQWKTGGIVAEGQVRAMPAQGEFGGHWEKSVAAPGHYQNGGYWGTMSGWLIIALHKVDPSAAQAMLHDMVTSISQDRSAGAPWEWINPDLKLRRNPLYCATVALPYAALRRAGLVD